MGFSRTQPGWQCPRWATVISTSPSLQNRRTHREVITAIYASPNCRLRNLNNFKITHVNQGNPWLLMGDFNVILGHHENQGGIQENSRDIGHELQAFLDCSDTRDPGFVGNPYTWSNNRSPPNRILEHLDRCLGNTSWLQNFGDMIVHHLPHIGSDHFPILIANSNTFNQQPNLFHFENMWLLHPGFHEVMQTAWERIPPPYQSLS